VPYPEEMVAPMRKELVVLGAKELRSAADVDAFAKTQKGTALLVVNSVCGCAAGGARPAVALALRGPNQPDAIVTVFAGQDTEATARARALMSEFPPSSPSFALFRDGKVVHFVPRHQIEGRPPQAIATDLATALAKHATAKSA
jgi:putative YphP/YqiW family bacilliredoxin